MTPATTPATPLVPLAGIDDAIYAKIEYLHPSGSMKHRAIPPVLRAMADAGTLGGSRRIAIASAGAAALATAWTGAQLGRAVLAVLPPSASPQIARLLRWLGAEHRSVAEAELGPVMAELAADPDTFVFAQSRIPALIDHYRPVGREILAQLGGAAAVTVGIGTGASITGIGRELKAGARRPLVIGVEPAEAAIAAGRPWAKHRISGLAPPIPQPLLDRAAFDELAAVPSDAAWACARDVLRRVGLPLGPSSGATVAAALELRRRGTAGPIVAVCTCSIHEYVELA
jgi:cysteine synthase A